MLHYATIYVTKQKEVSTMVENKNVDIRCRVDKETKDKWNRVTKEKAINGSELIRKFIMEWLQENDTKQ